MKKDQRVCKVQEEIKLKIKNNLAYGAFKKGQDISIAMTWDKLEKFESKQETIHKALEFFHKIHNYFGADKDILERLGETILGEAYLTACKNYCPEFRAVPPDCEFYKELRGIVVDYLSNEWIIDKDWLFAIGVRSERHVEVC